MSDDKVDDVTAAQWQQIAIEIGHRVRSMVNTPQSIGTEDETGYVLMFFNVDDDHGGKATLVSSAKDQAQLKRLLRHTLQNLHKMAIVNPGREQ